MQTYTVDDVYDIIGHCGCTQIWLFLIVGCLQIFIAPHMLISSFAALDAPFTCQMKDNSSTIFENKCPNNERDICEITYNNSFISVAQEWNLVCNEEYKLPLVQSVWMGGVMAGALFLGTLADKIGRLMTMMIAIIGTICFEGFSSFSPNYMTLLSLRFCGGVCCSLLIMSLTVLIQEIVGASRRGTFSLLIGFFFSFGIALLSLLAATIDNWRVLMFVISLSGIVLLIIPCFLSESPRWLLSQEQDEQAKDILMKMARKNGKDHLLPSHWQLASVKKKIGKKGASVMDLFFNSYLLFLTIIMLFSWFVNGATYYALTMASTSLPGNIYVSYALSGIIEIPSVIAGIFMVDRLGRRLSIFSSMFIGGLMCIFIPVIGPYYPSAITILALLGKLCLSASFAFIYLHSCEVYPTVLRNTGLGVVSVAARVGGIVSPFILLLKNISPNLEFFFLGVICITSAFFNLKLPETMNRPLPESIEDIMIKVKHGSQLPSKKKSVYSKLERNEDREALLSDSEEGSLPK